jgi:hypothetical protein
MEISKGRVPWRKRKGGFGGLESHGAFGPLRPTGLHRVALGGGETALEKNHLKASTSKTLPVTAQ